MSGYPITLVNLANTPAWSTLPSRLRRPPSARSRQGDYANRFVTQPQYSGRSHLVHWGHCVAGQGRQSPGRGGSAETGAALYGAALSRLAHSQYVFLVGVPVLDLGIAIAILGSSHVFWRDKAFAA